MSNKVNVPLVAVTVRRDANTITPTVVASYEVHMLTKKFGKESVIVGEKVGTREVEPEAEYERLGAKYGIKAVKDLYGDDNGLRLTEMVEKAAVKGGKKAGSNEADAAAAAASSAAKE